MSIEDAPAVPPPGTPTTSHGGGHDNVRPDAATKHGAHSPELVAPIRERHLDALRQRFPKADVTLLGLQATRLAQLELVGLWLDGKGIIRNRRFGTIWPAAEYWAKVASTFERQHERLEAQHPDDGSRTPSLAQITAEYAGNGDGHDEGRER
jgi:hypothetical protein